MMLNNDCQRYDIQDEDSLPPCEICSTGKLTSLPYQRRESRTSTLLALVDSDVCDPIRAESLGDKRSFLTITDLSFLNRSPK